jgi:hypothetical protein
LKTFEEKKFAQKKIMKKDGYGDFDNILNNFDEFCNSFETRAAEAYMRGDDNERVIREASERLRGKGEGIRGEGEGIRETDDSIQAPEGE